LGPTHPPIQWVPTFFLGGGGMMPGSEADPCPPSSAEVRNE